MGRHKQTISLDEGRFEDLLMVLTVPEVCRLLHVSRSAVMNAIYKDQIEAVSCGKIWLVHFDAAFDRWGNNIISRK